MPFKHPVVLLLAIFLLYTWGYEYCKYERDLCGNKRHIACNPTQLDAGKEFIRKCPLKIKARNKILEMHNNLRNEIACGDLLDQNYEKFPTAAAMHELSWDYELEYLAGLNCYSCEGLMDECRSTYRFIRSGQNLGEAKTTVFDEEIFDFIELQIEYWFDQFRTYNMSIIGKFESRDIMEDDFLLMVNDHVKYIGCAVAVCDAEGKTYREYITCNYSDDNVDGRSVYAAGEPASDCEKKSSNYKCLCAA